MLHSSAILWAMTMKTYLLTLDRRATNQLGADIRTKGTSQINQPINRVQPLPMKSEETTVQYVTYAKICDPPTNCFKDGKH